MKLDKPFLSIHYSSLDLYAQLVDVGLQVGRPDLQEKGMSLF